MATGTLAKYSAVCINVFQVSLQTNSHYVNFYLHRFLLQLSSNFFRYAKEDRLRQTPPGAPGGAGGGSRGGTGSRGRGGTGGRKRGRGGGRGGQSSSHNVEDAEDRSEVSNDEDHMSGTSEIQNTDNVPTAPAVSIREGEYVEDEDHIYETIDEVIRNAVLGDDSVGEDERENGARSEIFEDDD